MSLSKIAEINDLEFLRSRPVAVIRTKSFATDGRCNRAVRSVIDVILRVRIAVQSIYQIDLPAPDFICEDLCCKDAYKRAKNLFSGGLDAFFSGENHIWANALRHLARRRRVSILATLVSGKKLLPDPCRCMTKDIEINHKVLMETPGPTVSADYLLHCRQITGRLFGKGWDRGYLTRVESSSLTTGSCLESNRKSGGAAGGRMFSREEYIEKCSQEGYMPEWDNAYCRYSLVVSKGKARGITITPAEHQLLRPLHKTIYDYLSRYDWLLRGEATPSKLSKFIPVDGELVISGDYESATDNLSQLVAKEILDQLLLSSSHVPLGIQTLAVSSLFMKIEYSQGTIAQKRGQLMGNLLSFPLLCLQNYCAFTYLVPRGRDGSIPVLINGDDIVWRGTQAEYDVWAEGLAALGLTLSKGKTAVDPNFISINSTYFWARASRRGPQRLECYRLGMLRDDVESVGALGRSYKYFCKPAGNCRGRKELCGQVYLNVHSRRFRATGHSVCDDWPRGNGVKCTFASLAKSHLLDRELYYYWAFDFLGDLTRLNLREMPSFKTFDVEGIPSEFVKVDRSRVSRSTLKTETKALKEAMVKVKWEATMKPLSDRVNNYWAEVKRRGHEDEYRAFKKVRERKANVLGRYPFEYHLGGNWFANSSSGGRISERLWTKWGLSGTVKPGRKDVKSLAKSLHGCPVERGKSVYVRKECLARGIKLVHRTTTCGSERVLRTAPQAGLPLGLSGRKDRWQKKVTHDFFERAARDCFKAFARITLSR